MQGAPEPDLQAGRSVLLLYSYDPSFPTSPKVLEGLRSVLDSPALRIDQEFIDARHLIAPADRARYLEWIRFKLSRRAHYDAVVVADDAAFELATGHRELFPDTPTVFIGVNNVAAARERSGMKDVTGIVEHVSIVETVQMARALQPDLRRLVVVTDPSPGGQGDLATLRASRDRLGGLEVEVLDLTHQTWDALRTRLAGLGRGDAVLLLAAYLDKTGQPMHFTESLALMRDASPVPIYHLWEHGIGQGLVGGFVMSHRAHAAEAGRRILRIWRGTPAERLPVMLKSPNLPMVDEAVARRFRLPLSKLPEGTEIINRHVGLVERYPLQSAGIAAVILLLLSLLGIIARKDRERLHLLHASQQSEAMVRTLLDATPDVIFFKSTEGRYIACNSACADVLGQSREAIIGRSDAELFPAPVAAEIARRDAEAMHTEASIRFRERIARPGGGETLFETIKAPVRNAAGHPIGLVGVARDITADEDRMQRLQLAAEVIENTAEGIIVTDPDGRIERVNPAFSRITGYEPEEVIGQRPSILSSGRHDASFYQAMWHALQAQGVWQGEIWNRRRNGETYPEWLNISSVTDTEGRLTHYVGIFTDISLIKAHEAQLQHMAHHDALTNLPNRSLLEDRINVAVRRAQREHHQLGVVFIDLDNFKDVNDAYGHPVGDAVLKGVANRIGEALRDGDTVARLGGDEFVVLIEPLESMEMAEMLAHRIIAALAAPLPVGEAEFYVGASIGISIYPRDGVTSGSLIRNADTAMYRAKSQGRNAIAIYSTEQTDHARHRTLLENALRRALAQGTIEVAYQPQFAGAGRQLTGVEALARWTDPELGSIPPAEFIPLAESNGLIIQLGEQILRRACEQTVAWRNAGLTPPRVAINVSGRQLRRTDFVSSLRDIIEDTRCRPEWLEIEVTESDMLAAADSSVATLQAVRDLGIAIALDDFGTGYSSLSYLKRLPVTTIKIDRSFVDGLPDDANDRAIVEAILALGRSLRLAVLAEGVESAAQSECLAALGCECMQGYLYGRPVPPGDMARFMSAGSTTPT
ncbi:MAG: EAL domain-containing protein [Rhodocyclaceae bacterium]|nr:EAL domain-containing protein [Rhodocyclaceae bacterium]